MKNKKILLALTLMLGLTGCSKNSNLSIENYGSDGKITEREDAYNTWLTDVIGINQVVNKIHLSYIPIKYNDQLAYIPAWIFSYSGDDSTHSQGRGSFGVFAISAIDGEVHAFTDVYRWTLY